MSLLANLKTWFAPRTKSFVTEWEGEFSDLGAWSRFYDGYSDSPRLLRRNAYDLATAYLTCEYVARCIDVRAEKVAELLHEAQVLDVSGDVLEDDTAALHEMTFESFRAWRLDIWESWVRSLTLYGETYFEKATRKAFNVLDIPAALRPLNTLHMQINEVSGQIVSFQYQDADKTVLFDPDDIIYHYRFNPLRDRRGNALVASALESVNIDQSILQYTLGFFRNNAQLGTTFTVRQGHSLTPTEYERVKTHLQESSKGVTNAFRSFFFPAPVEATTHEPPALDSQITLSDNQRNRIAVACGVPVALVDFGDARFQLSQEQKAGFYDLTVKPDAKRVIRVCNADVVPWLLGDGKRMALNEDMLTAMLEDVEQRERVVRSQWETGRLTFNEARQQSRLPEVPDGDFYLMPSVGKPVREDELDEFTEVAETPEQLQPFTGEPTTQEPEDEQLADARERLQSPQEDEADEMKAWERYAVKHGPHKAAHKFTVYHVNARTAQDIRTRLQALSPHAHPEAVKQVFGGRASMVYDEGYFVELASIWDELGILTGDIDQPEFDQTGNAL